ncbi:prolipoprotein diacylglyceryl transferase [Herbidospora sp. RD11066]
MTIPSPGQSVWHLGPLPIRAYSLLMVLAVAAGLWLTRRRMRARGGDPGLIVEIATWAVPFGIVGARLYHVATTWERYADDPLKIFMTWEGGLGIYGALAGGALGAWIACRRIGVPLRDFADLVAPGIALGQAIARWGNWFNQELYGSPTTLPWGLEIDGSPYLHHPAFLYESLWDLGVMVLLLSVNLDRGRLFALYAVAYATGRVWIEMLRVDPAYHLLGLRLNVWTSLVVLVVALVYLVRTRPTRLT